MNNKSKLNTIVAAAILGLSNAATANSDGKPIFIPLEQLQPSERDAAIQKLELLKQYVLIDWSSVIVGINENGQLVLKAKNCGENETLGNPSCWTE